MSNLSLRPLYLNYSQLQETPIFHVGHEEFVRVMILIVVLQTSGHDIKWSWLALASVAQLVGALSLNRRVAGSILSQGIYT